MYDHMTPSQNKAINCADTFEYTRTLMSRAKESANDPEDPDRHCFNNLPADALTFKEMSWIDNSFFDRVSAKEHIAATFRPRESRQKTVKQHVWRPRKQTLDRDCQACASLCTW